MWARSTVNRHHCWVAQAIIDSGHHEVFEYNPTITARFYCKHCGRRLDTPVYVIIWTGSRWSPEWVNNEIVCSECRDAIEKKIEKRTIGKDSRQVQNFKNSIKKLKASLIQAQKMGML